ncbi:MAG: D-alanine--D-alanine ligase [Faecalibacterium sp.]|nr:D-alanine--D-alanine ligase [Faecalibacterium sp.]
MQSEKMCVVLLFGGMSSEHEVSRVSVGNFVNNIDREKYETLAVGITKEGRWLYTEATAAQMADGSWEELAGNMPCVISPDRADHGMILFTPEGHVEKVHVDVVIPVLHGLWGEDGTVQGLLEMANIPYASSGVLGSSVGMDKIAMKQLLRGAGYPVLDFEWFTRDQLKTQRAEIITRIEKKIKYPAFVKPASLGSSIGVSRVQNREELDKAIDLAASYDRRILVEVGVNRPVEINCAALGYGEDVRASVCEMPVPTADGSFLTFWEKYLRNAGTKGSESSQGMKSLSRVVPAPIGEELTARIQRMTTEIFRLLDCRGTVRIDYILDENDVLYVNEPNTIPGSLAFYLWKECGVSFPALVEKMVEDALRAHADQDSSVYAYDSTILQKVAAGAKGAKH